MDPQVESDVKKLIADAIGPIAGLGEQLKGVADAVKGVGVLAEQVKTLGQSVAKLQEVKPITAADLDARLAAQQQNQQLAGQRDQFISAKLADVKAKLPELIKLGEDPGKWAAEEQAIRGVFQERLKALGVGAAAVDGGAGTAGAAKAGAALDTSKLSGQQLIAAGLAQSKPIGPASAATAAAQQPAAAAAATK